MPSTDKKFNSAAHLKKEQYQNSNNLSARMLVHEKFSVATEPWFDWVWRHIDVKEGVQILELGAGTGLLWSRNLDRLPKDANVILTDLSEGMLKTAKESIGDDDRFSFYSYDVDHLNFEDYSFDIIIANHMLYHVPDLKGTLREVRRLLKLDGLFYAATNGATHMKQLYDYLNIYDPKLKAEMFRLNFVLENGETFLGEIFDSVDCDRYPNGLRITEVAPLVDYIYSLKTMAFNNLEDSMRDGLTKYFEAILAEKGVIEIEKRTGMFICR